MVARDSHRPCDLRASSHATNPVVVSSNTSATFVMCTVPKAGCSNLRKLLYAVTSFRKPLLSDTFEQFIRPHITTYATVWHYDIPSAVPKPTSPVRAAYRRSLQLSFPTLWQPKQPKQTGHPPEHATVTQPTPDRTAPTPWKPPAATSIGLRARPKYNNAPIKHAPTLRIPPSIPTFIVGRNPYIRVVSGFRDKMIANPDRDDQHTMQFVNEHFGMPKNTAWRDTPAAFQKFVRALAYHGVADIDTHFRPATTVCMPTLKYDYYLRLEDMHEWFPCWMHGLGLRGWTESGWAATPHGRMLVGPGRHFVTTKSFKKPRSQTPQWDAVAGHATQGKEGEHWLWVQGDQCWWSPKNVTCADYYEEITAGNGTAVPWVQGRGTGVWRRMHAEGGDGSAARMPHDTHSADSWRTFFDQETADLVLLLYQADFEAFGYNRHVVGA